VGQGRGVKGRAGILVAAVDEAACGHGAAASHGVMREHLLFSADVCKSSTSRHLCACSNRHALVCVCQHAHDRQLPLLRAFEWAAVFVTVQHMLWMCTGDTGLMQQQQVLCGA
jgi:hypothetical protein